MYADDTTVYVKSNNLLDCSNLMNRGLDSIGRWLSDSCLTLNVSKTQYVVFSRKQRSFDDSNCIINMNGTVVRRESCVKFLGVQMDENLLWSAQINSVVKKISKFVPIITDLGWIERPLDCCTMP